MAPKEPSLDAISAYRYILAINARFRASVRRAWQRSLGDFLLGIYLVGVVICAATVRRRPAEIALLWPVAVLILFIAVAIAAIDLAFEEIARRIADYNLTALPVIDDSGQMIGVVTVDDVLEVLLPKGWRRRFGMFGEDE